jgi:hypothetical protein
MEGGVPGSLAGFVIPASPLESGRSLTVQLVPGSPAGLWESHWSPGVQQLLGNQAGPC